MVAVILSGCSQPPPAQVISFSPVYQDRQLPCETALSPQMQWQIDQLWFYISQVELKTNTGWKKATLVQNHWQHRHVALLGQHCIDSDDSNWHLTITPSILLKDASQIQFTLGVPFAENHQNPMRAESIFANSNMFWTWQQGYKYLRLDLEHQLTGQNWAFHLGATGCQSASALRPPSTPCEYPNRSKITIDLPHGPVDIALDLQQLLGTLALNNQSRCLSLPTQVSCQSLFQNLGLTHGQSAFKLRKTN